MDRYDKKLNEYERKIDKIFREENNAYWSRVAFLFFALLVISGIGYSIYQKFFI
eukprot:COSAG01_NODE_2676_length_7264_cov_6.952128_4_plen_54_part_00